MVLFYRLQIKKPAINTTIPLTTDTIIIIIVSFPDVVVGSVVGSVVGDSLLTQAVNG